MKSVVCKQRSCLECLVECLVPIGRNVGDIFKSLHIICIENAEYSLLLRLLASIFYVSVLYVYIFCQLLSSETLLSRIVIFFKLLCTLISGNSLYMARRTKAWRT